MKDAEYEDADEVRQQQLDEFAHIDLTFSEFLLINIIIITEIINIFIISPPPCIVSSSVKNKEPKIIIMQCSVNNKDCFFHLGLKIETIT